MDKMNWKYFNVGHIIKINDRELLLDENMPNVNLNLSNMLPVIFDKKPENPRLMKIDK